MTDQTVSSASSGNGGAKFLARLWGEAHTARHARWQTWLTEICVLIAIIMALAFVLQPRIHLLSASPHPFWLPVIAASLIHGSGPGIVAASIAGLCAWLYGGGITAMEEDFYDLMLRAFKEPVLWLFAAILLGSYRDRIEDERQRLASEGNEVREDLGRVADHAKILRARIEELERTIVLSDLQGTVRKRRPSPIRPAPLASHRSSVSQAHQAEAPVAAKAPTPLQATLQVAPPPLMARSAQAVEVQDVPASLQAPQREDPAEGAIRQDLCDDLVVPSRSQEPSPRTVALAPGVGEAPPVAKILSNSSDHSGVSAPVMDEETILPLAVVSAPTQAVQPDSLFVGTVLPRQEATGPAPVMARAVVQLVAGSITQPPITHDWVGLWRWSETGWHCRAYEGEGEAPDIRRLARHFEAHPRVLDSRIPLDRLLMPHGASLAAPLDDDEGGAPLLVVMGGASLSAGHTSDDLFQAALVAGERLKARLEQTSC